MRARPMALTVVALVVVAPVRCFATALAEQRLSWPVQPHSSYDDAGARLA